MMLMRFKELYYTKIISSLQEEFKYKNHHQVPKLCKIVVNMSVGDITANSKAIDYAVNDMTLITGQKPYLTYAKKSIASFKLREGMKLGCKVTLRSNRMYEFLERLILVALPRVKEFRGFSKKSFDGRGNISFGIREQIVFPEIDYDKIHKVRGMDITIVTNAKNNIEAQFMLKCFNLPFYSEF